MRHVTVTSANVFLAKKTITQLDHLFTEYICRQCNFGIFPQLKIALKEQRYSNIPDNEQNVRRLHCSIFEN